jgi:hypothetical protein
MTYDLGMSDDDSEMFMLQVLVTIILSIVCFKSPKPMLSLAYFGFYAYHLYTAYDLIYEHHGLELMVPVIALIHALFFGAWAAGTFQIYYVLI